MSMSSSDEPPRRNNPYAWIEDASSDIWKDTKRAIDAGESHLISDEAVAKLMTAAARLYYMKADGEERTFSPLVGRGDEEITASEVLSAVSEMLRAMRLGPMELSLWFRRRPDEPDVPRERRAPSQPDANLPGTPTDMKRTGD